MNNCIITDTNRAFRCFSDSTIRGTIFKNNKGALYIDADRVDAGKDGDPGNNVFKMGAKGKFILEIAAGTGGISGTKPDDSKIAYTIPGYWLQDNYAYFPDSAGGGRITTSEEAEPYTGDYRPKPSAGSGKIGVKSLAPDIHYRFKTDPHPLDPLSTIASNWKNYE